MPRMAEIREFVSAAAMHHDLLDAERELGRLVEALARDENRRLWAADALRREVIASADLDGRRVRWEDLAVAAINPALLPPKVRPSTSAPLRLMAAGRALGAGLTMVAAAAQDPTTALSAEEEDSEDGDWPASGWEDEGGEEDTELDPPPVTSGGGWSPDIDAVLAAARQSTAGIEDFLAQPKRQADPAADDLRPGGGLVPLEPLSEPWLTAAWRRVGDGEDCQPFIGEVAHVIAAGLKKPGLMGVAAALHGLHRPGLFPEPDIVDYSGTGLPDDMVRAITETRAETQEGGMAGRFTRLLAPWLIMRACGLEEPGPWISPALRRDQYGYAGAVTLGEDRWTGWLCRCLANGFRQERERIVTLADILAGWQERLGDKRRWSTSRQALQLLVDQPAVTSRWLERQRGISRRAAQMLIREWAQLDIVQVVKGTKAREWALAYRLPPAA